MSLPKKYRLIFVALWFLPVLLLVLHLHTGTTPFSLQHILLNGIREGGIARDIMLYFRLPKAITCVLAGASLGLGGLLMQTLFRNAMAGPDMLGLSAGASLTVSLALITGVQALPGVAGASAGMAASASAGAALVFVVMMAAARKIRDNTALLIVGLMVSAAASSVVGVIQYYGRAADLQAFVVWTMGSVGSTQWNEIIVIAVCLVMAYAVVYRHIKDLNAWLLGDNYAENLGVNLVRSRFWVVAATSLLTGAVTAFCGPIAFVGVAVPHLVRLAFPLSDHKIMVPAVMLGGSALLLMCDLLARLPGETHILPLNAVTSLVGAPVVIWMVVRSKKIRM